MGVSLWVSAWAQEAAQQRVEITGSSLRRIEGESSAPVQTITRQEIERSGVANVEELMRRITAATSAGATGTIGAASETTGGISAASLRGLGAERTLVLVNGRRVAPYGQPMSSVAVDVDSIPLAAIERVEVLKDGASAVYGSDAIAGVVNFILRRDFRGREIAAGYGSAQKDGRGAVKRVSGVLGFGDYAADGHNVMLSAHYQRDAALFGRDRDFAASSIRLDHDNSFASSTTVPANIDIPGVPGTFNPRVSNGVAQCGPTSVYVPAVSTTTCLFDRGPYVALLPEIERMGVLASGRVALNATTDFYGDISLNRKTVNTVIQPSPVDSAVGIPFTLRSTSPFYPTAFVTNLTGGPTPDLRVRYRSFIVGDRDFTDTADSARLHAGVQGTASSWDYDVGVLYSASRLTEKLNEGYFRINGGAASGGPGLVPLLDTGLVNPFGDNTPAILAQAQATVFRGTAFETNTSLASVQGKASRDLRRLPGGPMALALGVDLRREAYGLEANPALGTGDISGYGGSFSSVNARRSVLGAFGELGAPVAKNLHVDAAVRVDAYGATSNPGDPSSTAAALATFSSVNGDVVPQAVVDRVAQESAGNAPSFGKATAKLGLRWNISPDLLFRGTASTGFRAPSLLDLYGPVLPGLSETINDPARCAMTASADDCATQFYQYNGGRSTLKPEESRNLTLGFVFEPSRRLSVGVDVYFMKVSNLITTLSPAFMLANEAAYASRIHRGAPDVAGAPGPIIAIDQRLENLGKVYIQGFDLDVRGRVDTPLGRMTVGWGGSYVNRWESQNPDGSYSSAVATSSSVAPGIVPRFKQMLTLALARGPWTTSVAYHWQSGYKDVCGNLVQDEFGACPPGTNPHVGPYETMDAQLSYGGVKGLVLALGVKNAFDRRPPYVNGNGGVFQSGYDPSYADPRGRYLYLNASYKF